MNVPAGEINLSPQVEGAVKEVLQSDWLTYDGGHFRFLPERLTERYQEAQEEVTWITDACKRADVRPNA
jgi:hypothetical protein